jgi:small subunit ribosomal protein S6
LLPAELRGPKVQKESSMAKAQVAPRAREYEAIYVLRPDVARDNAARIAGRVEEVVGREGGKLTLVETWGRRLLAYPVSKHKRGVYVYLRFVGTGNVVSELERNLRMQDDVLKYLTIKLRDDIDLGTLEIKPEDVKFEAIEPPAEGEELEESRERELGLDESSMAERPRREHDDLDVDEEEPRDAPEEEES